MAVVIFLILIGLIPPVFSLVMSIRAQKRLGQRLSAPVVLQPSSPSAWRPQDPDLHYVDGLGFVIGDITCQLNARSPYVRCAVNPTGPCEGCRAYEERSYDPV